MFLYLSHVMKNVEVIKQDPLYHPTKTVVTTTYSALGIWQIFLSALINVNSLKIHETNL